MPWTHLQCRGRRTKQGAQRAKAADQAAGDVHGTLADHAHAQEDSQQFRIRERRGAVG
jgi:hypothetical protein